MLTGNADCRRSDRTIVVGSGMGGLAAALRLTAAGRDVLVLERQDAPGGKARLVPVGDVMVNGGPTVLTMKWVFDDLLAGVGGRLEDHVRLVPAALLARHFWTDGTRFDLYEDIDRSAAEIETVFGAKDADGYRRFCADGARVFGLLKDTFIDAQRPNTIELIRRIGCSRPGDHIALRPFSSLWSALTGYFQDPRLRQLFGRYATYCGSSPFLAPATLMLVAHVEQAGGWRIDGGMHGLARALADAAKGAGAEFRFDADVAEIATDGGAVTGVRLRDGELLRATSVIYNGDVSGLAPMLPAGRRSDVPSVPRHNRSLSAVAFCMHAEPAGVPLAYHTVFFNEDYKAEFEDLFERRRISKTPTAYMCAQDRPHDDTPAGGGAERLLCLINAPATGDQSYPDSSEIDQCLDATLALMTRCGLKLDPAQMVSVATGPVQFHTLFPGSGGAIYGPSTHGMMGAFNRQSARTRLKGLYLAGGTVHPGPGVPMAALSGKLAAELLVSDQGSMPSSRPAGTFGGMLTA